MSFCVSHERTSGSQLNACPLDCNSEPEVATCGSDGSVYRSECEMQMINCGSVLDLVLHSSLWMLSVDDRCSSDICRQARRKVSVVEFEKCRPRLTKCTKQQQRCGSDVDPVCGSDANTYPNQCHLNVAVCL